jgi:hypothetical protein
MVRPLARTIISPVERWIVRWRCRRRRCHRTCAPLVPRWRMTPRPCGNGYRSTKRQGKPNLTIASKQLRRSHF